MFLGHYAVAFAAKKAAPKAELGTLCMAAQLLDLLWPAFLLLGIEHVAVEPRATQVTPLNFYDYPYSHSLAMALLWAALFGVVYFLIRNSRRAAIVLGACVLSHWVLDWVSHRPDMPLWPGRSPFVGLGLWNHPALSFAVEFVGFGMALALYLRVARQQVRPAVMWPLVALLLLIGASSYMASVPPSIKPVMWSAFAQWILIAWAYTAERNSTGTAEVAASACK